MSKILLNDCSEEITREITDLLGDNETIINEPFAEERSLNEFRLIILGANDNRKIILQKIKMLRYACNFRDIPIILIKHKDDPYPEQRYILTGATDVLSLPDSPVACRQILQGYLTPNRQALEHEMTYITPFIDSTCKVISMMASMEPEHKATYFRKEMRIFGDVSGVIGLSGEAEGTVAITFYWNLANEIIKNICGLENEELTSDLIHDGVGELVNMISGSAKTALANTPYHFQLSLPTIVIGSGHEIGHRMNANVASLIFDIDDTSFSVQVCLSPRGSSLSKKDNQSNKQETTDSDFDEEPGVIM